MTGKDLEPSGPKGLRGASRLVVLLGILCACGCLGVNPSEGDYIPGDWEHREKTCFDTTYNHNWGGQPDTVVAPRECRESLL